MRLKMKMGIPHLDRAPQLHKCQRNESPMESQVRKKGKQVGDGPVGDQPVFPSSSRAPFSRGSIGAAGSSGYGASIGSAATPRYAGSAAATSGSLDVTPSARSSGSAATPRYVGPAATPRSTGSLDATPSAGSSGSAMDLDEGPE